MSNRSKGKALVQTDPFRKPKKRSMKPKRITTSKTSPEQREGVYGGGIILACLSGLMFWFVVWLAFC